jgi:hypothetical protein
MLSYSQASVQHFIMTFTTSAHLTCLCGAISVPCTLLSDQEIPMYLEICHCNPCRRTTGSLGASFPQLKSSPSQATFSKLTAYNSSQIITRYFCSTCGCHCFILNHRSKNWYCLGGIVEPSSASNKNDISWPKDIIKVSRHDYVLDTLDGGLVPLLLNLNSRSIPTWSAGVPESPPKDSFDLPHATILSLPSKSISHFPPPKENSYLTANCHCGGVALLIRRANYKVNSNPEDSAHDISSESTKYPTYLCACRSCRLSTGVSLQPWALVSPANVFNANAPAIGNDPPSITSDEHLVPVMFGYLNSSPDANPGLALKHNWSSSDVCRSFCGKCGATVFYWCGQRPDELGVAVGVLRSEEGSMARRWLDWEWGRCSAAEECIDEEVCKAWLGSAELMNSISG